MLFAASYPIEPVMRALKVTFWPELRPPRMFVVSAFSVRVFEAPKLKTKLSKYPETSLPASKPNAIEDEAAPIVPDLRRTIIKVKVADPTQHNASTRSGYRNGNRADPHFTRTGIGNGEDEDFLGDSR